MATAVQNKNKVSVLAKDFGMSSKDVVNVLKNYADTVKGPSQVLDERELSILFEYLTQKNQVQTNIGAASKEDVAVLNDTFLIRSYTFATAAKISASGAASYTTTQFNIVPIEGYSILCIFGFESSVSALMPYAMYARSGAGEQVLKVRNVSSSDQAAGKTLVIKLLWVKNQLLGA